MTSTTDLEREAIREALYAIVIKNHGVLNPKAVLDAARDPVHPLHAHFEWDDTVAGDAYRLLQVGALVRRVKLTVIKADDQTRTITIATARGFQSRPSMRTKAGGYEPTADILADEAKRGELLAMVLRDLQAYRKRYAELSELQVVWFAVDEVVSDLQPSPSVTPADGESRPGAAG